MEVRTARSCEDRNHLHDEAAQVRRIHASGIWTDCVFSGSVSHTWTPSDFAVLSIWRGDWCFTSVDLGLRKHVSAKTLSATGVRAFHVSHK
jgi:hypothetical protein